MSFDYSQIFIDVNVSDWDYFPNVKDDKKPTIVRVVGKLNNKVIVYIDYFVNNRTCYILAGWTASEYRNLGIMTWFGGEIYKNIPNDHVDNYIWLNAIDTVKGFFDVDKERFIGKNLIFDNKDMSEIVLREE